MDSINDRLARVESRLVQLMLYIGADPYSANAKRGFLTKLEGIYDHQTQTARDRSGKCCMENAGLDEPCAFWNALDKPTIARRGGVSVQLPDQPTQE